MTQSPPAARLRLAGRQRLGDLRVTTSFDTEYFSLLLSLRFLQNGCARLPALVVGDFVILLGVAHPWVLCYLTEPLSGSEGNQSRMSGEASLLATWTKEEASPFNAAIDRLSRGSATGGTPEAERIRGGLRLVAGSWLFL